MKKAIYVFLSILMIVSFFINAEEGSEEPKGFYVTASSLKLRSEPSLKSKTLTTMDKGDYVFISEYTDKEDTYEGITAKWIKLSFKGHTGYAFSGFLGKKAPRLFSESEIKKFNKNNERVVKQFQKEEEKARKKDPNYQNCEIECSLDGYVNIDADEAVKGCRDYKMEAIRELYNQIKSNENDNYSAIRKSIESYGDKYCHTLYYFIQSQCGMESHGKYKFQIE